MQFCLFLARKFKSFLKPRNRRWFVYKLGRVLAIISCFVKSKQNGAKIQILKKKLQNETFCIDFQTL